MSLVSLLILILLGAIALAIVLGFIKKIAMKIVCVVVIALILFGGYHLIKTLIY